MPGSLDVICLGVACTDLAFAIERDPGLDEKIHAQAMVTCGGGMAANAAVTVARLGGSAALISYLGRDPFGEAHVDELRADGVHVDWIERGETPTPLSAITVKPQGQRAIVHYSPSLVPEITSLPDLTGWRARAVLVDGHHPAAARALVDWAHAQGVPAILDADAPGSGTESLLDRVDFLVASARFARQFTGLADPRMAARLLNEYAPSVVVTLGERGLVWSNRPDALYGKGAGQMSAFFVPVVDTTGAGDAFHGAFALGISRQMGWSELLGFASAVAALTCTRLGSRLGIPDRESVAALLEAHGDPL